MQFICLCYAHTCEPHKRLGCAACIDGVCPGFTCARASHKSLRQWLLKLELCAEDCMTRIPPSYHPCRPLRTSLHVWSESTCQLLFAITTVIKNKQISADPRIVTKTHISKIHAELLLVFTTKKSLKTPHRASFLDTATLDLSTEMDSKQA